MNPEQLEQFEQLLLDVEDLNKTIESLRNSTTIPFDIGEAMIDRTQISELQLDTTSKALNSEQHGSESVGLKNPEAWVETSIDGVKHFIAAYK